MTDTKNQAREFWIVVALVKAVYAYIENADIGIITLEQAITQYRESVKK